LVKKHNYLYGFNLPNGYVVVGNVAMRRITLHVSDEVKRNSILNYRRVNPEAGPRLKPGK
jgi:hypothetical protein